MKATIAALLLMLIISPQLHASDSKEAVVSDTVGRVQQILVLGAVHNPGFHPIKQGDTIRLKTAIAIAGGLTSEAEESDIRILRPKLNESGTKENYTSLSPESLSAGGGNNPELQIGDIVYVPTTEQTFAGHPE
jgi:protein involved in polysaccharide export with SLBB domain